MSDGRSIYLGNGETDDTGDPAASLANNEWGNHHLLRGRNSSHAALPPRVTAVPPLKANKWTFLTPVNSATKKAADAAYGASAVAHGVAALAEKPLATVGFENFIINTLPLFSMVVSAFSMADAAWNSYHLFSENRVRDSRHIENLLQLVSNGYLFSVASASSSQLLSLGSTAVGSLCGAMALRAMANWVQKTKILYDVTQFCKNKSNHSLSSSDIALRRKVFLDFALSSANLLGWGMLALAHLPALAAAAPVLLTIGGAFLLVEGLGAGYTTYRSYKKSGSLTLFFNNQQRTEGALKKIRDHRQDFKIR